MASIYLSDLFRYVVTKKSSNCEGPSIESIASTRYDPDQSPPNIEMAIKHGKAKRVYQSQKDNVTKEICPCCGLPTQGQLIPLTADLKSLYHLGSGFALYFLFIKYCIGLLLLIFSISGVYLIVTAVNSQDCEENLPEDTTEFCAQGFVGSLTLANKRNNIESIKIQLILNLASVVAISVFFHLLRYSLRKTDVDVDREVISPADFTVVLKRVPPSTTDEELTRWIQNFATEKFPLEIRRINRSYDIKDYLRITNKKDELIKKREIEEKKRHYHKVEFLHKQIAAVENSIEELKKNNLKPTPIVFVTFRKPSQADYLVSRFQRGLITKLVEYIVVFFSKKADQLDKARIKIKRAPEPTDVIWENLSFGTIEKAMTRFFTRMNAFLAIGLGFGIIIFIYWLQRKVSEQLGKSSGIIQILSIVGSLSITVINSLLTIVIRIFTQTEKHSTVTRYSSEMAEKLSYAQLINTAFIPLFAKLLLSRDLSSVTNFRDILQAVNFYGKGGLLENMFYVFLTNAILPPLFTAFNPSSLIKYLSQKYVSSPKRRFKMTQKEAHELFEENLLDIPGQYALLIKTMLLTCFYAPAMPIALVISIIGIFLFYWANKYSLLRRSALPNSLDNHISREMVEYLEWMAFVFAMGNLLFIFTLETSDREKIFEMVPTSYIWVTIAISLFHIFFPMEWVNKLLFKIKDEEKDDDTYDQVRPTFPSDYDIENPITRKVAILNLMNNLKFRRGIHRPRKTSQYKTSILDKVKVEAFLKFIKFDSISGKKKTNQDFDLLEDYAREGIQRKATIFNPKQASSLELKDLKVIFDEFEGLETVMEEGVQNISDLLIKAGRKHKWKEVPHLTSYFSFGPNPRASNLNTTPDYAETNKLQDHLSVERSDNTTTGGRKRSRTENKDVRQPLQNDFNPRIVGRSAFFKDRKDSANVTRTETDVSSSSYPINVLETRRFGLNGENPDESLLG